MTSHNINEGAGDSPRIPIGPIQSFHQDRLSQVSHHDDRGKPIEEYFNFHEVIGKGGFSKVRKVVHKATGDEYAVKILDKCKIQEKEFPRVILEIETLASVSHPCICKLYSAFYTSTKIFMVMEYANTDLYEYLVRRRKPISESKGRRIFIQLLSAISYLHYMHIVHRDIKPENILLTGKMRIKLCDFGFSSKVPSRGHLLSTYCGSLAYGAPEVVSGKPYCGMKADVWSLGVNLYVILSNRQPFWSRNSQEVRTKILCGRFQVTRYFSKRSINLIKRLLTVMPQKRPSVQDIWKDLWIKEDSQFIEELKLECGPLRPISSTEKLPDSAPSLVWFHQPVCRSEPVQHEETRNGIRRLLQSTRRKILKFKNLFVSSKA